MYLHTRELHNTKAAEKILPIIIGWFKIKNVLDIGCGIGSWLNVVEKLGISDFIGIDGDYVDRSLLMIPVSKFKVYDLREPLILEKKFDLVISLEVAEHLPESSADIFVNSLVKHADLILFSAAIPNQGGQNHLNEKWPKYWKEKFEKLGYSFYDIIRPLIWEDKEIEWWYRQNIFIIMRNDYSKNRFVKSEKFIDLVHPEMFEYKQSILNNLMVGRGGLKNSIKILLKALKAKLIND